MGLRWRSQLCHYRAASACGALGPRHNELRRRSRATRRRPEASLGRSSPGTSPCWQDGRRSADCRRLRGPLRCGQRCRRHRRLLGTTRALGGSHNTICGLRSRCLRGTLVAGRIGLSPFPARRSARVVARHSLPHQPPHQLPECQVRIHVRQQLPQLLQSARKLRCVGFGAVEGTVAPDSVAEAARMAAPALTGCGVAAASSVPREARELESSLIRGAPDSSGHTDPAALAQIRSSRSARRVVAAQAGLTRLRRFSGWPAWMRPRAIASMIVNPIVMRSRILVSPRMNGWSNPYPPANRLLTRSTALRSS